MRNYFQISLAMVVLVSSIFLGAFNPAAAGSLFSFLLPTQNLNINPPDQNNRSNLAMAQIYSTTQPSDYQIPGDSFTLGTAGQSYHISKIRLWMAMLNESSATSNDNPVFPGNILSLLSLWAGPDNSQTLNGQVNTQIVRLSPQSVTATRTFYANGQNLLRTKGGWRALWQLDFAVNWTVQGGQLYHYFLDGLFVNNSGNYQNFPLHAANGALSGVSNRNTNSTFLWFDKGTNTILVMPVPFTDPGTSYTFNNTVDANIEINPNVVTGPIFLLQDN
jgi:hypothetical protein